MPSDDENLGTRPHPQAIKTNPTFFFIFIQDKNLTYNPEM
jgi:hypothetical protein